MSGIISIVGGPGTVNAASGGKVYGYNGIGTLGQVVPANPSRRKLTFHNVGIVDIYVNPTLACIPATGALVPLNPTPATPGGCFIVFQNGGTLIIEGECQGAWQAFVASGTGKLTVMDSNL